MDTASSRANAGDFENGENYEQDVKSADFYFYDAQGAFVANANVWNGGSAVDGNGNIEFKSNTVVVLKGLDNKMPCYMVTVLNKPVGFNPGNSLADMQSALSNAAFNGINDGKYFTMSTTSFAGQTSQEVRGPIPYFVTEVKTTDFKSDPTDISTMETVKVYVERLAAKIGVGVNITNDSNNSQMMVHDADKGIYKMRVTVAGADNSSDGSTGDNIGAEWIYIKFGNWALNATAKNSYMIKNINEGWTTTNLGFDWNDKNNQRSYWAKSWTYDQAGTGDKTDSHYNYTTYAGLFNQGNTFGTYDYCAENTHPAGAILNSNFSQSVTSVLLSAQIFADADCTQPLSLVRYKGLLYKNDAYVAYVLNTLALQGKINFYKKDGTHYEALATDSEGVTFSLNNLGNGRVCIVASGDNLDSYNYQKVGDSFEPISGSVAAQLNDALAAFNAIDGVSVEQASSEAIAYNGGNMRYTIPIEHMREADKKSDKLEGQYGVVRNHIYKLNVRSISNLGDGVYDPDDDDETIIPDDPTGGQEKYQVGATINILSWKIVSQNVDL